MGSSIQTATKWRMVRFHVVAKRESHSGRNADDTSVVIKNNSIEMNQSPQKRSNCIDYLVGDYTNVHLLSVRSNSRCCYSLHSLLKGRKTINIFGDVCWHKTMTCTAKNGSANQEHLVGFHVMWNSNSHKMAHGAIKKKTNAKLNDTFEVCENTAKMKCIIIDRLAHYQTRHQPLLPLTKVGEWATVGSTCLYKTIPYEQV